MNKANNKKKKNGEDFLIVYYLLVYFSSKCVFGLEIWNITFYDTPLIFVTFSNVMKI